MNATRKVKLKDITGNLTCKLCLGYLVDATTIIECLHSFCKSCIVKYLEKSADLEEKYCPVCDVQLHSTKPLTSIRSDLMLQEIVYKLVPGLFKNEMSHRRKFYGETPGSSPTNQLDSGQVYDELYITSDDIIHLSMDYVTTDVTLRESARRYLKCPAAVSVCILKKFLRGKYDLPGETNIDLMFGERILPDDFLLMDIAYKYSWTMNGSKPLALSYRIKGITKKLEIKRETTINDTPTGEDTSIHTSQDEATTPIPNKKKVCNENGSNIMPVAEDAKINPIKFNGNGLIPAIPSQIPIAPIKTPNGKVRGRKRKNLNYSDIAIDSRDDGKSLAKRMKLPKQENSPKSHARSNGMVQSSTQVEANNITGISKESDSDKEGKEVQLQISENGVMSARSGKEKIILNMESPFSPTAISTSTNQFFNPSPTTSQNVNLTEKILLSGNCHSKTGPGGVTEIICDKPDPLSAAAKPSIAKPGYVTLNIPNPNNPIYSQPSFRYRTIYTDADKMRKELSPQPNGKSSPKQGPPNGKLSPKKKSSKIKLSTVEKIKNRIQSKGKDGENVIKAITDLGKLCSSVNGLNATKCNDAGTQQTSGLHSLPIMPPLHNNLAQKQSRPKVPNGTATHSGNSNFQLPLALNFSPASGMSVSMIPCTATNDSTSHSTSTSTDCSNSNSSITPPKRPSSHQTTVVNGDLKFTTSPKNFVPLNLEGESSPKKPPKFFKSRHSASPVSTNKQGKPQKAESDSKRRTPTPNGNGLSEPSQKKVKEQLKESDKIAAYNNYMMSPLALGSQTITSPIQNLKGLVNGDQSLKPLMHPLMSAGNYPQHLHALAGLAGNPSANLSSIGSNGNGLHGMVPFVTDSYCSMPFLNQGHPIPQMAALPFGFPYPTSGLANPNFRYTDLSKSPSSKSDASSGDGHGHNLQAANLNRSPKSEKEKEALATLDLTVHGKSSNGKSEASQSPKKESSSISLLANLLNSTNAAIKGDSDGGKIDRRKSKTPVQVQKISNGDHQDKRPSPSRTFSPSAKQESSNMSNGQNGRETTDKKEESSPLHSKNGNKEGTPAPDVNKISPTNNSENTNGSYKANPQNGNSSSSSNNESETKGECQSVKDDGKLSSLTVQNNNNPTVSNNYDKSATVKSSSDSASKLDCAKTGSNDKGGVSSSTAMGPKCGSA